MGKSRLFFAAKFPLQLATMDLLLRGAGVTKAVKNINTIIAYGSSDLATTFFHCKDLELARCCVRNCQFWFINLEGWNLTYDYTTYI